MKKDGTEHTLSDVEESPAYIDFPFFLEVLVDFCIKLWHLDFWVGAERFDVDFVLQLDRLVENFLLMAGDVVLDVQD